MEAGKIRTLFSMILLVAISPNSLKAQEKNVLLSTGLGLFRDEIVSVLGTDYQFKLNDNGSAFLYYELRENSSVSGNYTINCLFMLNSDFQCYYITAILPPTEYKRTVAYLDFTHNKVSVNTWLDNEGRQIKANLKVLDSGTIFTLDFSYSP